MVSTPKLLNLHYEDVEISTPNEPVLRGWFLPSETAPKGTIIFLHGNSGNISNHWLAAGWLLEYGYSILTVDYRGYGLSDGEISIAGIHRDIERILDYAISNIKVEKGKLVLFGQSIGASMALYLSNNPSYQAIITGVVADSPFASYRQIAREKLREHWLTYMMSWPLGFLVRDTFSPADVMGKNGIPTLLLSCQNDRTVPPHHSEELRQRCSATCAHIQAIDCDHVQALADEDVRKQLLNFLARIIHEPAPPDLLRLSGGPGS
jgi:hypothetical protein